MPNTNDLTLENHTFKVLVYGPPGVGKTVFASTFPKPYFFDCDNGLLSIRGTSIDYDPYHDVTRNGVLAVSGWDGVREKLDEFERECPYLTLVVDGISTLEEYILNRFCADNGRKDPSQQEYGQAIKEMQKLFLRLMNLPQHVVVTAHELVVKDELQGGITIQPLIIGKKFPQKLPMYFDEVYRMHIGETTDKNGKKIRRHLLHTVAGTNSCGKSRLRVLDPIMEADFNALIGKVREEEAGEGG